MTLSNGNIFRVTGPSRSPANSPHKGQWRGALMFALKCAWTNGRVNNRDAANLRRHCAHYNVIEWTNNNMQIKITDMESINSSGSDCRPTSWILRRRPPGLGFGLLTICLHILHSVFKFKNVLHVGLFYPFLPSHSRWDPAIIKYHFTVPGWAEILCLVSPGQMMPPAS